jgi:hypothetical protein
MQLCSGNKFLLLGQSWRFFAKQYILIQSLGHMSTEPDINTFFLRPMCVWQESKKNISIVFFPIGAVL